VDEYTDTEKLRSLFQTLRQTERPVSDIDPREFGKLEAEVGSLRAQVSALQRDVRELLELANKSRGGFWFGLSIAGLAGSVVSWFLQRWAP
jgi:hypothetical protein